MPFALARTLDSSASDNDNADVQRSFFTMNKCCMGFTSADLREKMTVDAALGRGGWTPFWERTLFAFFDSIDLNTADVEGAHASHAKLLVGSCGGGSGFSSFAAKSVNRQSSAQYESGVRRNKRADELRAYQPPAREESAPRGGGSSSGKHLLHYEVCKVRKCKVNDAAAHAETSHKWAALSEEQREAYNHRAKALRHSLLVQRAAPPDAPPPPAPPQHPALCADSPTSLNPLRASADTVSCQGDGTDFHRFKADAVRASLPILPHSPGSLVAQRRGSNKAIGGKIVPVSKAIDVLSQTFGSSLANAAANFDTAVCTVVNDSEDL